MISSAGIVFVFIIVKYARDIATWSYINVLFNMLVSINFLLLQNRSTFFDIKWVYQVYIVIPLYDARIYINIR